MAGTKEDKICICCFNRLLKQERANLIKKIKQDIIKSLSTLD